MDSLRGTTGVGQQPQKRPGDQTGKHRRPASGQVRRPEQEAAEPEPQAAPEPDPLLESLDRLRATEPVAGDGETTRIRSAIKAYREVPPATPVAGLPPPPPQPEGPDLG